MVGLMVGLMIGGSDLGSVVKAGILVAGDDGGGAC